MDHVDFKVEGLHCDGCVKSVTRMLTGVPGVAKVEVSLEEARASVDFDAAKAGLPEFKRAVERAGFRCP
ncbi:MAG TPA: heavy-metal-associated domain-containing protein [Burkholderiales bacterium]